MAKKQEPKQLEIKYTRDMSVAQTDAPAPSEGNAGTDLRAAIDYVLQPNETRLIPTSYKMIIPNGYVGLACSRSGLAKNKSVFVLNSPGVIDPSYRGNWGVILHNASRVPFEIHKNDRIAQVVFVKYEVPNFTYLGGEEFASDATSRGEGGFGSTGVA